MSDAEIVKALERAGIEIEQFVSSKPLDDNIVVGLVKKVVQHPGADRLKIVTVDDGREELTIVCGAPNVREGLKVPLARLGAVLPDGTVIAQAKLRGETSFGMLCSERELGLGDSHEGLLELSQEMVPGKLLCDIYHSGAWVDIKTPPNRFDLLSSWGLAREVAAMSNAPLELVIAKALPAESRLSGASSSPLIKLEPNAQIRRFMVAELEVQDAPTPAWMTERLAAAGMRSVGLVVDITNYVMLETGQPLHAYNAKAVTLPFGARLALAGESLTTLDDKHRVLSDSDIVVTDGREIIGLAGVRGGDTTEYTAGTQRIYLEAASFDGSFIRQTARRHNARTEASARFERGIPVETAELALRRATGLLVELAAAKLIRWDSVGAEASMQSQITLTAEHVSRILGIAVTAVEAATALERLEIASKVTAETLVVTPPWWRPDLREAEDIIEEVVRVIGYDRLPSLLPPWRPQSLTFDRTRPALRQLAAMLTGAGLFEVMSYSFVSEAQLTALGLAPDKHLALENPLSVEQAYLRSELLTSHLAIASRNRKYGKSFGFYELSRVFLPQGEGAQPREPLRLGLMVVSPADSFRRLKGVLDGLGATWGLKINVEPTEVHMPWAPGRTGEIELDGKVVGRAGQLHPAAVRAYKLSGEVAYAELDMISLLEARQPVRYTAPSPYPPVLRDITLTMPEAVTWQQVEQSLATVPGLTVKFASDFSGGDLPAGHKSMSIHLALVRTDRTPTDAEAAELEARVRSILRRRLGAESR